MMNFGFHNKNLTKLKTQKSTHCKVTESSMNSKNVNIVTTPGFNGSNNTSSSSNLNSSPKMGSRRIFTPQFKLQVLESYRNDNDCKGNQRATARKYNIHRRQIQKWLQCESNLRSSVANIHQSNVKHQFHNVTSHHQHQQHLEMSVLSPSSSCSHQFGSHHHQHRHEQPSHNSYQQSHQQQTSFDTAGPSLSMHSATVPSLHKNVKISAEASAQEVLAAANLAAVVAATTGVAGALAIASTSNKNASAPISPLRPTAIVGSSATIPQSIIHPHHRHHHNQYPLPSHTYTPANVPILAPHFPSHHLSHHYQYHHNVNVASHAHTLTHQPSAFVPANCLPTTAATATAVAITASTEITTTNNISPTTLITPEKTVEFDQVDGENCSVELHESIKAITTSDVTGNCYVHSNPHMYKCVKNVFNERKHEGKFKLLQSHSSFDHQQSLGATVTPMDLSLNSRHENKDNLNINFVSKNTWKSNDFIAANLIVSNNNSIDVVDLTLRKRKVISNEEAMQSEKITKVSTLCKINKNVCGSSTLFDPKNSNVNNCEESLNNEKRQLPLKPIKLFKPYLLDDNNEDNNYNDDIGIAENEIQTKLDFKCSEQRGPITLSSNTECISLHSYDSRQDSSRCSNFQTTNVEKHQFPIGNPYFPESKASSPKSNRSTTSAPVLSPDCRCPKGSPVSGYESSSSTYSEISCRNEPIPCCIANSRAYTFDIQMHTVYNDNLNPQQNHIQRWLDHDANIIPPALYA